MDPTQLAEEAQRLAARAAELAQGAQQAAESAGFTAAAVAPFIFLLAIFLMACFVGYYVVWNVTPALHSPLMAVTNAISSVIIVGAMLATGLGTTSQSTLYGFFAVTLASVNIFGGFLVTQRMLSMFKARVKPAAAGASADKQQS
jgi:NAD(P) transhydrogenase subunit alpha